LNIYLKTFALYPGLLEPVRKKILPEPLRIIINIRYHSSLPFVISEADLFIKENKMRKKMGKNGKKRNDEIRSA
jgi:hypothetical protein